MQQKQTDIRVAGAELYFLPIQTRVPLKFGNETLTHVTVARARVRIENRKGTVAEGWGETPLSVQWVWPSAVPYEIRHEALKEFCASLAKAWASFDELGHPMTLGAAFQAGPLHELWREYNSRHDRAMPWLAALVCCSLFDIAVHDAYGNSLNLPTYATYNADFMNSDLNAFIEGSESVSFAKKISAGFFCSTVRAAFARLAPRRWKRPD